MCGDTDMSFYKCFSFLLIVIIVHAEELIPNSRFEGANNDIETRFGLHSFLSNIQKLKQKTALISADIERTAPAGALGNLASSVIAATSNATVNVILTTSKAVDAVAKEAANWMKNVTTACSNKGAEMVLREFQEYAFKHDLDNMTLPSIDTKISGVQITASGGYFSSFASLYKTKSINVTVTDEGILIKIPLSLAKLDTGYNKFTAKLLFVSMSAALRMKVQTNDIDVILRLKAISPCALNVDRVEVVSFEGLKIEYKTDCKTCSSIISRMSSGLANYMKNMLKKQVQEGIDKGIKKVLKDDTLICSHFVKSAF